MSNRDPGQLEVAEHLFGMRKVRVDFHLPGGRVLSGEVNHFSMTGNLTTFGIGPLTEKQMNVSTGAVGTSGAVK